MKFATTPHARHSVILGLALMLSAGAASAQMYKWVDAKGKTHYTDTPPPATAKVAPIKSGVGGSSAADLPYALAQAVRNNPVVLYTTASCGGCDAGRALLKRKGIPFTEKTVTSDDDAAKLKELGGDGQMPMLAVGRNRSMGFLASNWEAALSAAAYPTSSMLPSNYKYANPSSLAPKQVQPDPDREAMRVAAAEAEALAARKKAEEAAQTAPAGFQF